MVGGGNSGRLQKRHSHPVYTCANPISENKRLTISTDESAWGRNGGNNQVASCAIETIDSCLVRVYTTPASVKAAGSPSILFRSHRPISFPFKSNSIQTWCFLPPPGRYTPILPLAIHRAGSAVTDSGGSLSVGNEDLGK